MSYPRKWAQSVVMLKKVWVGNTVAQSMEELLLQGTATHLVIPPAANVMSLHNLNQSGSIYLDVGADPTTNSFELTAGTAVTVHGSSADLKRVRVYAGGVMGMVMNVLFYTE